MWNNRTYPCTVLSLLTLTVSCSYIIDLEDAYQINDDEEPTKFMPELHYREWGIAGPETNCHMYGLDPMVPHDGKCIDDPDDEILEKMAADAAGKELVFGK